MRKLDTSIFPSPWKLTSPLTTLPLVCLVVVVVWCLDIAAQSAGIPPSNINMAPFWPITPFLVAVLLLTPRRLWPLFIAAGLGALALFDFSRGTPPSFLIAFFLGNLVEVLIATLGISILFKDAPRLTSLKALARFSAFAVMAPFVATFLGASAFDRSGYWLEWRIAFLGDLLGLLTVTPAILTWMSDGQEWARKPRNYLELATLLASLTVLGYFAFMRTTQAETPALLYSLVPLLLWAALRLGLKGVSTSILVIAFLAIWGAAHDRGPFTGQGPFNNVLSLQLFLFFAAIPFMVLAMLVEEEKRTQRELIDERAQLSTMSQKLIEAHEEERTRIARELHDDINQQIALLSVNLDGLKQDPPASDDEMSRRIDDVREDVSDLGNDVQALSHRLHSSKLEYLGLESAASGFCREFSALKNVEIDFHAESVPKDLPKEISICLFRVLQEALQNALKHSGSRHFAVSLRNGTNAIELTVHDSGAGFDPQEALNRHGLGLTSMKERLKLVDGQFVVDSNPQSGTTIHARVPLSPKAKYAGSDG
jgi:two-component system sensor histidine kinase UhpB